MDITKKVSHEPKVYLTPPRLLRRYASPCTDPASRFRDEDAHQNEACRWSAFFASIWWAQGGGLRLRALRPRGHIHKAARGNGAQTSEARPLFRVNVAVYDGDDGNGILQLPEKS